MSVPPPPLCNPLDGLIGYRLRRLSAALMADVARDLSALGLKTTEASILLLVDANAGITQSDVGRALGIKSANMAPLTAALYSRDLVMRRPVDGRSHGLVATPAGAALSRAARAIMDRHDADFLGRLSAGASQGLRGALGEIAGDYLASDISEDGAG